MTTPFVVDSSVLVALLKAEPHAQAFEEALKVPLWLIGWPTILEIRIWLIRRWNSDTTFLDRLIADDGVKVVPFDGVLESIAGAAYAMFGKGRHPASLNYGDCMGYALARHHDMPLLFKGGDFGLTDVKIHPSSLVLE